ncbi:hypothetical protein ETD86_19150 [Nonomuraea turkmeniaca]|uniref:Uncharacterized protein n=1 Tax=Nonomuraea turkmeniaca TaxID=103838 RepID=A0A5S4FI54_9ACTN|nr:hypothetical protein [Nonomuraea turkmeniaca]TMR20189.1 hypothetical protein ETD86_19150 [Nonomuraea turkmeniaca]
MAAPTAAVSAAVTTDPLASSQAAAAEIATFWLGDGGANLAAATPYSVQTAVSKIVTGSGGISPDTQPGSIPPSLPATTGTAKAGAPTTAGKVFFAVYSAASTHWSGAVLPG